MVLNGVPLVRAGLANAAWSSLLCEVSEAGDGRGKVDLSEFD